jgi:hypothetical protein
MITADLKSVLHNIFLPAFVAVGVCLKPVWKWLCEKIPAIKDVLLGRTEPKAGSGFDCLNVAICFAVKAFNSSYGTTTPGPTAGSTKRDPRMRFD